MGDKHDQMIESVTTAIYNTYGHLAGVCQLLPIPIALPVGDVDIDIARAAVEQLANIADDQPVDEGSRDVLGAAASYWLTALDVLGLAIAQPRTTRLRGALSLVVEADECAIALTAHLREAHPHGA